MEKLDFLIEYLLKENGRSVNILPIDKEDKMRLYRGLVNIRDPRSIPSEFLEAEDEFLQNELSKCEVTDVCDLKTVEESCERYDVKNADKICLWKGDITKIRCDAVVNAANSQGLGCFIPNHNCIDNQIQTFAGVRMRLECNEFMKKICYDLPTSKCFITGGYNLPVRNVIHAVGPIVDNSLTDELRKALADTYMNCLKCAAENSVRTISFPCISTGVFMFPKNEACRIAIKTVDEFLSSNRYVFDKVVFNLWSEEDIEIYGRYI